MDLDRMLEKCSRDAWDVGDLPWDAPPPRLPPDDEAALVQSLVDMVAVERLAAVLFAEQARRAEGTLREILLSFVRDEERHAEVATRLAARFDVRKLRPYAPHPALVRFSAACARAIPLLPADVANLAVTLGELVLDVALLRAIEDQSNDSVLQAATRRIDRDESRHVAIDVHLVETGLREPARGLRDLGRMPFAWLSLLAAMRPFVRDVLVRCTARTDPEGRRLREAFRRFHQLGSRPGFGARPFGRLLLAARRIADHALLGPILGRPVAGLLGVELGLLRPLSAEPAGH